MGSLFKKEAEVSIFDKYDLLDVNEGILVPDKPATGIVVVVGSSGSGKSTILKEWGHEDHDICELTPIIDLFPTQDIGEKMLIASGLRSIPSWRRTLGSVSNGERHRAEIAVNLSRKLGFIDEFTSVVDRNTARGLCVSINKSGVKDLVIATCHRDVLDWLDFDVAYDTDSKCWVNRGVLWRQKPLKVELVPCDTETVWGVFKKHHYLSGSINKSANSWAAYLDGYLVGMTSIIAFPSGNWKDGWRDHRIVVLPEFQGMGIGSAISDMVADIVVSEGGRFFSKTAHPALGEHRENSSKWKPTTKNKVVRKDYNSDIRTKEDKHKRAHAHRNCYSHEYIG